MLDYAGIRASELSARQQQQHGRACRPVRRQHGRGHAKVKMDEVRRHLDDTCFAWIGGTEADSVFYYRIHSPVILIEFDHQRPANLRGTRRQTSPRVSTSTPWCARPTATTTARTCCASITCGGMAADLFSGSCIELVRSMRR